MGKTHLLVFLLLFWSFLTILGNYFEVNILDNQIDELLPDSYTDNAQLSNEGNFFTNTMDYVFDKLDNLPLVNNFTPLLKIMFFRYTDQIPAGISIFLNVIAILSSYMVFSMVKGNDS